VYINHHHKGVYPKPEPTNDSNHYSRILQIKLSQPNTLG